MLRMSRKENNKDLLACIHGPVLEFLFLDGMQHLSHGLVLSCFSVCILERGGFSDKKAMLWH